MTQMQTDILVLHAEGWARDGQPHPLKNLTLRKSQRCLGRERRAGDKKNGGTF